MNANQMKRKIAVMLCMAMLCGAGAYAESPLAGLIREKEPEAQAVEVIAPEVTEPEPQTKASEEKEPAKQETVIEETEEPVIETEPVTPPVSQEEPVVQQTQEEEPVIETEPVVPPVPKEELVVAVEETEPEFTQIEASVTVDDAAGTFTVKVTSATAGEQMIAYVDGLSQDQSVYLGDTATFTVPQAGEYALAVAYLNAQDDSCTYEKTVTVNGGGTTQEQDGKISDVALSVTPTQEGQTTGTISGKVEFTGDKGLIVRLYEGSTQIDKTTIAAGGSGSFAFSDLGEGEYALHIYFAGGDAPAYSAAPYVKAEASEEEPVEQTPVRITRIIGGVNQMTVRGTAEPGRQIQLTTTPASTASVYALAGSDGVYEAVISCAAGTYTKVTAQYSDDASSAVTATGTYIVQAPTAKPTLTVDPIDFLSDTVVARTTPGVDVQIRTPDFTQRLTADTYGIVRFSLPYAYVKGTKMTFTVYYGVGGAQSFSTTVTVGEPQYNGRLTWGSEGEEVRRLTTRLKELGYPVSVTSYFDDTVERAVRLFQEANGLNADGEAGRNTQAAIYSVSAIRYGEGRYPTLVRGDDDNALIYKLQKRLKELGYYTIAVDGIFGSATQRAVRDFQKVNGLTVTGKADDATQRLLYSSSAKPAYGNTDGEYRTLKRSSRYQSAVVPLQRRLRALGYYSGSIDGYFGSQTYRAVRNFQKRNGLDVTGKADPYTQQILYSSKAKPASGSYVPDEDQDDGYRLLYWGCKGSDVKRLQNALISAGYKSYVRTADGVYGQWTYDAVRAYQKDHGLSVDGVAGRETQNSLYGTHY